jgi:thiamine biosynthesis lipoprotein
LVGEPGKGLSSSCINFDFPRRRIRFLDSRVHLDFGAFGKGYALDRVAEILAENGVLHAIIHGGTSSVLARGFGQDGQAWRVALRDSEGGESGGFVDLTDAALSCSGVNDQADIIDPRTGLPLAEAGSCAVVAPSAAEAEILSTAAICLGNSRGTELVESREGCRVYWDGRIISGGR